MAASVAASVAPASAAPVVQNPPPNPGGVSVRSQKPVPQSALVQQYCTHSPVVAVWLAKWQLRSAAQNVFMLSQEPHSATVLPGPAKHW